MAILEAIRDIPVTIKVGGEALQEYIGDNDDGALANRTVTRYIEAAPGAAFEIHAELHTIPTDFYTQGVPIEKREKHRKYGLAWQVVVDGEDADPVLIDDEMVNAYFSPNNTCISRGLRCGSTTVRPYQFSAIKEGGSSSAALGEEKLAQLGSIKIIVHRVEVLQYVNREYFATKDIAALDESALKGRDITNSISLADAIEDGDTAVYTDYDVVDFEPVATYVFKYHSKRELQKLNIIPRDQEPEPQDDNEDLDLEDMSPAEILAEAKRLRIAGRERGETIKEIKREVRERNSFTRRKTTHTVIELDEDGEVVSEYDRPQTAASTIEDLDSGEDEAIATVDDEPRGSSRTLSPSTAASSATPFDKLDSLRQKLHSYIPDCENFLAAPPTDPAKKKFEHKRLTETILAQVLLKLDGVETEGNKDARAQRKAVVKETQAVLDRLDAAMKSS